MVKYVSYKNEKYPVSISFHALEKLEEEGLDLADEKSLKPIKRLFWHALVAGHFHENKELQIKEADSSFILDWCFSEFQLIMPLFLEMLTGKNGKAPRQKKQTIKN